MTHQDGGDSPERWGADGGRNGHGGTEAAGHVLSGRADVWLGDLVRAVEEIAPRDDEEFWRVARMLGLGPGRRGPARAGSEAGAPGRTGLGRWHRAERPGTGPGPATTHGVVLEPGALDAPDEGRTRAPVPVRWYAPVPEPGTAPRAADPRTPSPGPCDGRARAADARHTVDAGRAAGTDTGATGTTGTAVSRTDTPGADTGSATTDGGRASRTLDPVERAPAWPRTWVRDGLLRPDRKLMAQSPPYTPLLARSSAAALLEAALSGRAPDGDVEIEHAVELLARGLPLAALPRRMRRTLRHGVQILVDHGPAMELFARDQVQLCARVEALVGTDKTGLLHFAHAPLRGAGPGPLWTWEAYRPPPRDSAVLLLSDCGVIGPPGDQDRSTPAEWRRFAELVRGNGARPLALLPVPEQRVPEWLSGLMPVLCWDRGTTVGRVAARVHAWREGRRPYGGPPLGDGSHP